MNDPQTVRPPRQARSRDSLERILAATEELLEETPFDELRVSDIARRAGVSVGSFYGRFPGKESLLDALYERYAESLVAEGDDAALERGTTLEERVRRFVRSKVARFRKHRGLLRTLALRQRERRPEKAGMLQRLVERQAERLDRAVAPFLTEVAGPDAKWSVQFAAFVVMAAIRETVLFDAAPHARFVAEDDDHLVEDLTRTFLGHLRQPSDPELGRH